MDLPILCCIPVKIVGYVLAKVKEDLVLFPHGHITQLIIKHSEIHWPDPETDGPDLRNHN